MAADVSTPPNLAPTGRSAARRVYARSLRGLTWRCPRERAQITRCSELAREHLARIRRQLRNVGLKSLVTATLARERSRANVEPAQPHLPAIERTLHPKSATIQHVRVHHRRAHVRMPE